MLFTGFFIFPKSASTFAGEVDAFYFFMWALTLFFAIGIAATVIAFIIRYRRSDENPAGADIEGSLQLEIMWTAIPFAIAMGIFAWSASIFVNMQRPPDNAMEIFVVGKQWMWKIQHMEGRSEINQLHVPLGKPVKLTMTSEDVIHSFYVPAFRIKADVVPGRYNTTWFEATKTGTYHLFCTEYCGTNHSRMIGQVVVMEQAAYQDWLAEGNTNATGIGASLANLSPAARGEALFTEHGCKTCHFDGPGRVGPLLGGLPGSTVKLEGGDVVAADSRYLRESILNPRARVVEGYEPLMPTFAGRVSEEDVMSLVAYIKTLSPPPGAEAHTTTAP